MFNFANYLISQGVSEQLLYLLLALPLVTFVISFFRYYIGLKTFGVYEPVVISFAMYLISPDFITGSKFGLPIIILAWLVSELVGKILKDVRMHYISKVSIKISVASLLMILSLYVLSLLGQNGYFTVNPLAIIIILALVESVSLFKVKAGDLRTNLTSLETLSISLFSYFLITLGVTKNLIINYPYVVVLPIMGSVLVGRWTGLRLSEFIKFKNALKND